MLTNLENDYQTFIYKSRYARWLPDDFRREHWEEVVERYIACLQKKYTQRGIPWAELREAILKKDVMPSMRALMTAGAALERDNISGYNCGYLPIEDVWCFSELMYILMCGTGVGFSIERQYVNQLPEVPEELYNVETNIIVGDSKIGWVSGFKQLLSLLYAGQIPRWDLHKIRPAGEPLKTFGGRASGPECLDRLFEFTVATFVGAKGRKLTSLECHDLCCQIGATVVVGGVRRSALISLSNLSDGRMRKAKQGEWYKQDQHPNRSIANNSVAYTEKPDMPAFMEEWMALYESKSGERGVFNRVAAQKKAAENGLRDPKIDYGVNPCSEIILRPYQFCNLTEVIARPEDTASTLIEKVQLATILGTLQAGLTKFKFLRPKWKKNCEEEALLGVSITGIMDNTWLNSHLQPGQRFMKESFLQEMRQVARSTNEKYATIVGINPSAAITCVKPSGTVSQLCGTASGIHTQYSEYYIRRVRQSVDDPLTSFLIDQGVPHEIDLINPSQVVFSFPMKAPAGSTTRNELSAIDQLKVWQTYARHWCEHKPSVTIYVKEHEWLDVGAWVYRHFDEVSGISFLPHSDHSYEQAPYEEINEDKYLELVAEFPPIEWELFDKYEAEDNTTSSQELACVAGVCEI